MDDVIAILQPCCSTDATRPTMATPFLLMHEGRRWAVGTDGRCMAMLPFDGELRSDGPKAATAIPAAPPTHRAAIAALRSFAGEPKMEACRDCQGVKTCTCPDCDAQHPCGHCGGKGEKPATRYGLLLGGILNRDLLLKILATAPAEIAEVTITHAAERGPFAFRASGWMGLIMPIVPGSAVPQGTPTFTPEALTHGP